MIVLKFGGQTIGTPERLSRSLDIIASETKRRPIVVVSAHGRTTDELIAVAKGAAQGQIRTGRIRESHTELAESCGVPRGVIDPLLTRLEALLHGIGLLKELTPRTMDNVLSFGERLSSRIVAAALSSRGIRAVPVNSYDIGLLTDSNYGSAQPLADVEGAISKNLTKETDVPVITGFIGKDEKGEITTLGRSGSDLTATIIASAVDAEEVVIWKSVDGLMTADPDIVKDARNIPEISFDEASELAYFGAEVLHPSALIPAIRKNIPVRVANVLKDNDRGTVILSRPVLTKNVAKSVAYKEDVTLIHLVSPRFHSVPDVLSRALQILKEERIVAHMITTSEAGISLITESGLRKDTLMRAEKRLSEIASAKCEPSMAIICMVGDELKGNADSIGKIFGKLAEAKINARAITRSASEINVAFLVPNERIGEAVRALHTLI